MKTYSVTYTAVVEADNEEDAASDAANLIQDHHFEPVSIEKLISNDGCDIRPMPIAYLEGAGERIDLHGEQGNAWNLMAIGAQWLEELDLANVEIEKETLMAEMMAGDYHHLLNVMDHWFNTNLLERYESMSENDD